MLHFEVELGVAYELSSRLHYIASFDWGVLTWGGHWNLLTLAMTVNIELIFIAIYIY